MKEQEDLIQKITTTIGEIKNCQFASLTYLTKKSNELSRYVINLGFSYHNLVEKSVGELEQLICENKEGWSPLEKEAAEEVMTSLKKTLAAHEKGEQNEDYTKKGQYLPLLNGISINLMDGSVQLFGLVNTKKVLVEGQYPKVNSAPLTIAKNKIRGLLSISKFREFALDSSQVMKAKVNGEVLEME